MTARPTVFLSYSHLDKAWRDRFTAAFAPLERYVAIDLWSDQRIEPGEDWPDAIDRAMDKAIAAVMLVSMNFLASDFICNRELPYILKAAKKRHLTILWVKLTPCYTEVTPLRRILAAAGMPKPLNSMTEFGWMTELNKVCAKTDAVVKKLETPIINTALNGRTVSLKEPRLQVLAKPAFCETEVLIFSNNGYWYRQSRIAKGSTTTICFFGDTTTTKPGATFKVMALTRGHDEGPLPRGSKYPNLPDHRTKSQEVTVKRR